MNHVIIGASAAGVNAARFLRQMDPASEITIVSRDREVYSRCMLHLNLGGKRDVSNISFVDGDFMMRNRINWQMGENAVDIRVDDRRVLFESGESIPYDKLLIASGASSLVPPIPNLRGAKNVFVLRNLDDVGHIASCADPGSRAVIVGAGLVGMDAVVGLLDLGVKVTLVEMADRILAIQLDDYAASRYAERLRRHGVEIIVGTKVDSAVLDGGGAVKAIELADGRVLECDFCLVAAGVAPNIGFIRDERIGLTPNKRAVAVDRRCRTTCPDIFAAGDVTFLAPIWPEAVRQAKVAAGNMAGKDMELPEQDWAWTNSMNFFGLPTVSYGHATATGPEYEQEIFIDGDVYKKVIHKDGRIHGVIFQGDIDNCGVYLRLVRDQIPFDRTGKHPLRLNYADFFEQAANGEFI